jgi:hypothetical protein
VVPGNDRFVASGGPGAVAPGGLNFPAAAPDGSAVAGAFNGHAGAWTAESDKGMPSPNDLMLCLEIPADDQMRDNTNSPFWNPNNSKTFAES